jgi:gamma-glutamyltranspeptidase/glutathione hydrolase
VGFALQLTERSGMGADGFLGAEHVSAVADVLAVVSELKHRGFDTHVGDLDAASQMLSSAEVDRWAARLAALREERHLGSTTHISVADGDGGAASLTTSNGEGSGHVLEDLGIHVNNFMGEEDINPDGFHAHRPGTRLSTMMSPTIALRNGSPVLVLGSGGSNRIRSVVYQGLLNRLHFHRDLDEAMNAPRLHVEGDHLWFEAADLKPEAIDRLLQEWPGATQFPAPNMFFGGVHAVALEEGEWVGAGDRRRGGVAMVQSPD